MAQVSLAVIGCGVIGRRHLEVASRLERCHLAAACDLNAEAAEAAARQFGAARALADPQAVFDDPGIDAVVLALPTNVRAPLAMAAFDAGKHVLIEKPAAMNAGQLREIMTHQGERVGGCCSSRPSTLTTARRARELFRSGGLGPVRVLQCRAAMPAGPPPGQPPPVWRLRRDLNAGGILVNWGVYDLDFLLAITDWSLTPTTAFAAQWLMPPELQAHQAPGSDAETHIAGTVRFEGGAALVYERGERVPALTENSWAVIGEQGALRMTIMDPKTPVHHDFLDPEQGTRTRVLHHDPDSTEDNHEPGPTGDFVAAILDGRAPLTSLENALTITRITDALYRSAESGQSEAV